MRSCGLDGKPRPSARTVTCTVFPDACTVSIRTANCRCPPSVAVLSADTLDGSLNQKCPPSSPLLRLPRTQCTRASRGGTATQLAHRPRHRLRWRRAQRHATNLYAVAANSNNTFFFLSGSRAFRSLFYGCLDSYFPEKGATRNHGDDHQSNASLIRV